MRITEILTESQLEQLDEGPMLNKFGTAVGNVAGGVAKGVGAVAGGIAGMGSAFKKGFDRSKGIVGQGGDYEAPPDAPAPPKAGTPAPTAAAAPAAAAPEAPGAAAAPAAASGDAGMSTTTPPSAAEINAQGPKGTAPAKAQTGDAGKALAKSTAVVDKQQAASQTKANQTVYAQIKANVDKLDKKGKQQILQLLQKSMSAPAPAATPAKPGAAPAKPGAAPTAGAGAFGQMAQQLAKGGAAEPTAAAAPGAAAAPAEPTAATPAAATPAAATPAAKAQTLTPQQQAAQAATKARLQGTKAAGKSVAASTTGGFKAGVAGARAKGIATAGKINHGNALSETLAQRVETHKQKMFETGLAQGTISVFRK